jgi:hypothetical protein
MSEISKPLPLGTQTQWGKIGAVGYIQGERYYWMIDEDGSVSMMPAFVVETPCLILVETRALTSDLHGE